LSDEYTLVTDEKRNKYKSTAYIPIIGCPGQQTCRNRAMRICISKVHVPEKKQRSARKEVGMAEYKRWMAYLYNYENGFKKNCVGTARIERRGNEAKTTVSIQVPSLMNEALKNFYYIRTPEGVRGISAGEYTTNGSNGNWQISMNADDMGGSGLELERMDGYLICRDSMKYFASAWDDKPLLPTEVYELLQSLESERNQPMQPDRIELPVEETENQEDDIRPDDIGLTENKESEQDNGQTVRQASDVERGWEETDGVITEDAAVTEEWMIGNAVSDNLEKELQKEIEAMTVQSNSAERIFELCPVIWPFAEPWAERCVKLELEDIGLLPAEHWQLTTNSFLMHSYYGYRHLVLARVKDGARYRYELLVPGIYNEREKEIAGLFGFDEFRNTKSRPIAVGEYGYWSMPVVF